MPPHLASLPAIELRGLDSRPTTLQEYLGRQPTVVLAVRYYGCLPCQHYLVDLHERRTGLTDRGVAVVVVGVAADFQAKHVREGRVVIAGRPVHRRPPGAVGHRPVVRGRGGRPVRRLPTVQEQPGCGRARSG